MAEKTCHYWFDLFDADRIDTGTAKHRIVENGAYIRKYKITVPKELYGYE
jgi:hypothetical protein